MRNQRKTEESPKGVEEEEVAGEGYPNPKADADDACFRPHLEPRLVRRRTQPTTTESLTFRCYEGMKVFTVTASKNPKEDLENAGRRSNFFDIPPLTSPHCRGP